MRNDWEDWRIGLRIGIVDSDYVDWRICRMIYWYLSTN